MNFEITSGADHSNGIKTVIYGPEGIGKTLLAAKFPDPLFIDTEGSTTHYDNIKRLPKPKDWKQLNDMIDFVSKEKPCQTLVIDTFDWAEMAEVNELLKENGWRSIESPGYGKGYIQSAERIASFLNDLETKLIRNGINVVLACHSQIRKMELPEEQGSFDKYELKLGNKTGSRTSPLVKEWADMILFCNFKTYVEVSNDGMEKKAKATGGTERVMYATKSAVWDAKNRFGLPDEMPLSFDPLKKLFTKSSAAKPKPKTKPKPKPQAKAEESGLDWLPDIAWPSNTPKEAVDLCIKNNVFQDDLQLMLFQKGITKDPHYDLAKVPAKFWKSFVDEFDTRWLEPLKEAQASNIPF